MDATSSTRRTQAVVLPVVLATSVSIGACAVNSSQVQPVQTGSTRYEVMECAQLATEELKLRDEIKTLSKQIDEGRTGDRVAMGIGVVFWPALFLIDGKGEIVDLLAQKKGDLEAAGEARERNGCNIRQRQVDKKPSEKVAGQFIR